MSEHTTQDEDIEDRVRMLEEIVRGQADQIRMLVDGDRRRVEIDQSNVVTLARMADAMVHLKDGMSINREAILEKLNSRFDALTSRADLLDRKTTEAQAAQDRRHEETRRTLTDHEQALADHNGFVKAARWAFGLLYVLGLALAAALINKWVGK